MAPSSMKRRVWPNTVGPERVVVQQHTNGAKAARLASRRSFFSGPPLRGYSVVGFDPNRPIK